MKWEYKAAPKVEVHACQPLANGNVLIAEGGSARIIEVDRSGAIVKELKLPVTPTTTTHEQIRGARKLANGHYLLCLKGDHKVVEIDGDGKTVREIKVPGDVHEAVALPNGNILISCGDGHKVMEVDRIDKVVWEVNENDLPNNPLRLCGGLQRLPNGNTIICNYLGHGHLGKQAQFLEVTREKKVVWEFRDDQNFKTINQVQLLDVADDVIKGEILRRSIVEAELSESLRTISFFLDGTRLHRWRVRPTILGMQKSNQISRRQAVGSAGLFVTAALTGSKVSAAEKGSAGMKGGSPFVYCLNTATIRGQKLGLAKEIEVAAQAGFQAIEPWVGTIEEYAKGGGSLKDMKKKIADLGLTVESAIGFPEWIVDDETRRAKGLEKAKADMDLVAQIGGKRLAAPPSGATNAPGLDLLKAAERYRALLEAGDAIGVTPQLELWGFSKNLNRLSECAYVAIETGHPKACVLSDVFHMHKGGSDFRSIRLLSAQATQVVHLNDFPAEPPRAKIDDSYRVFPGDGVAPLTQFLQDLRSTGDGKVLSLELFNKKLWAQDALEMAKAGLAKMQAAVKAAIS